MMSSRRASQSPTSERRGSAQLLSPPGPVQKSASMDFQFHADYSRSASNSPTATKRFGFYLSSSDFQVWTSQEELTCHSKYKTLPSPGKYRSASVADVLNEDSLTSTLKVDTKKQKRQLSKKTKDICHPLHYPKSSEALSEILREGYNPNILHVDGLFPIHTYIDKRKKKYIDFLYVLLSQSNADVNWRTLDGMPPLHMAVQSGNHHVIKLLLVFEANINSLNSQLSTPLDIAVESKNDAVISLLQSLGAVQGEIAKTRSFSAAIPRLKSFYDTAKMKSLLSQRRMKMKELNAKRGIANGVQARSSGSTLNINGHLHINGMQSSEDKEARTVTITSANGVNGVDGIEMKTDKASEGGTGSCDAPIQCEEDVPTRQRLHSSICRATLRDMEDGNTLSTLYERLQQCINITLDLSDSFSANTDEAIAVTLQQKELLKYKKTGGERKPYSFNVNEGSRILFLDGGGIRGLIQIEILEQLEQRTGRKVTELFDWIVGTSTGGIVALALVYAKKSLSQLRQLYFKMKDKVFGSDRFGFAYNTEALEKLLKDEFGSSMKLSDVDFPKVVITAVYKRTTMPELHFFNNCFDDDFSTQLVWKVARYTSAAPMFFREFEDYVDGGVLANNPCSYGFSAIQNFHRQLGQKLDVALAVSVGCGIFPIEDLGKTDAQEFLFFGKHWLKAAQSIKARAKSLVTLLTTALVESESVARSFSSRMEEQAIPFYRFNPHLDEVIPSGETDLTKLVNMLIKAKVYVMNQEEQGFSMLNELVQLFHLVAEMNRKKVSKLQNKSLASSLECD